MIAVAVIEAHVIRVYIVNVQVAVGVVVAVRLVVLAISQPPIAAVGGLPLPLLRHFAIHGILRATATAILGTSHVHNQVRLPRVVCEFLTHGIVHQRPVLLAAWRPDLETFRTRMLVGALPDFDAVLDLDQHTRRIALHVHNFDLAVFRASLTTANRGLGWDWFLRGGLLRGGLGFARKFNNMY